MKLFENDEKTEKMFKRLEKLESLPSTKEALASEKAETLAKRQAAAAEIREIEGDTATLTRLDRDIEIMAGHLKVMDDRRDGLAKALNEKRAELMRAKLDQESGLNLNRGILYATAWHEIDEAIQFFRDKLDDLRKPGRISTQKTGAVRNVFTWKKSTSAISNGPAVRSALAYCQAAVKELETMKLMPELDLTRIEALRKGVPDYTLMTEIDGEKDLERFQDPAAGIIPSDESHDWSMKKLNQKIQKVLHGV